MLTRRVEQLNDAPCKARHLHDIKRLIDFFNDESAKFRKRIWL